MSRYRNYYGYHRRIPQERPEAGWDTLSLVEYVKYDSALLPRHEKGHLLLDLLDQIPYDIKHGNLND